MVENGLTPPKLTISDYELGKVVGQGAYGKVILSRHKATN